MKPWEEFQQAAPPGPWSEFQSRGAAAPMTERERYMAHPLVRLAKGGKDAIDAGAQLAVRGANALVRGGVPEDIELDPIRESVSRWLQDERSSVDKGIAAGEREYQTAQEKAGTGFDGMRLAGNVLSPANAITARAIPLGGFATPTKAVGSGVVAGGVGAVAGQPVVTEDQQQNFAQAKGTQALVGGAAGGVLSPILAAVVPRVVRYFGSFKAEDVSDSTMESIIQKAFRESKIDSRELGADVMEAVRSEVRNAMAKGRSPDVAALARSKEFDALGVKPLLGQITRDPTQFATEMNLRGVRGGEGLQVAMTQQGQQIGKRLDEVTGKADEPFQAGERIKSALQTIDREAEGKANVLYEGFRDLFPKGAKSSDPARFSNDLIGKLEDDMALGSLSADWHSRLNKITAGEFPLTASTLHQMYVAANRQLRSAKGSEEHALGLVKSALNEEMVRLAQSAAPKASATAVVPFGTIAPEAASANSLRALQSLSLGQRQVAQRYGLQEELPALKAAVKGEISGEDFVNRFIVNEDTAKVKRLGEILEKQSRGAWFDARSQIGSALQRAAYGPNLAGDKAFSAERFARTVDTIGADKLRAFYSTQEVEVLQRIARVASYINAFPDKAAVNTSNTGAAIANLMAKLPMGSKLLSFGTAAARLVETERAVKSALAAKVPSAANRLPELEEGLADALTAPLIGFGVAAGSSVR